MCKPKITVTRRTFMKNFAAGVGGIAVGQLHPASRLGASTAFAASNKRLLTIFLDGGVDDLAMRQPDLGALADRRSTLFQNSGALLAGPTNEGFHSSLTQFKALWDAGDLAVCSRVGYLNHSRSHEESRNAVKIGKSDRRLNLNSGWMNRLGAVNFSNNFSLFDFTGGDKAVDGPFLATSVRNLANFGWAKATQSDQAARDVMFAINDSYEKKTGSAIAVAQAIDLAANAEQMIQDAIANHTTPGGSFPNTSFGRQMRDAYIAFTELGTEAAYVSIGGFDTHSGQASRLTSILNNLNTSLASFIANMQAKGLWNDTIVMIVSEFSRTITENGSSGTDHGGATSVYLAGPSVRGGLFGGAYTAQQLQGTNSLPRSLNYLDVYRPLVSAMGYDPNKIFESSYANAQNLNLFT